MAMYYNIGGKNMLWDQANEECKTIFEQNGFKFEDGILKHNGYETKAIDINKWFEANDTRITSPEGKREPAYELLAIKKN